MDHSMSARVRPTTTRIASRTGNHPWVFPSTTEADSTRITDGALIMLSMMKGIEVPGLPEFLPFSDICAILLLLIASTRDPRRRLGKLSWIVPTALLLLTFLILASVANDLQTFQWSKRAFRISLTFGLAILVAEERIDIWSGLRWSLFGIFANGALFYAHLAPDDNAGLLTGYLGEKNRAGLMLGVNGMLALYTLKRSNVGILAWIALASMVWLTGSRTTMVAFTFGSLWVLLRPHMNMLWLRATVFSLGFASIPWLQDQFEHAGEFADRVGTDRLRTTIDQAASAKTQAAPWYGDGLGEADVYIDKAHWLFHNAYLGLRVEGGWIFFFSVLAFIILLGLRPLRPSIRSREELFIEGAIIAELICAWRLGEVFLSTSMFPLYGLMIQQFLLLEDPESKTIRADSQEAVISRYSHDLK